MDAEDLEDEIDVMLSELCAEVTKQLNDLAEKLGVPSRVWYVTVVSGQVVVLRFPNGLPRGRPRLFGQRRTAPGGHAWGW